MKKTICTAIALAIVYFGTAFAADLNKDDAATIAKDGMGIGMKKAEMIVAERNAKGPFKDWADLKSRIKGFGPATIDRNKDTLTFGPAAPAATAVPAATVPTTAAPVAPAQAAPAQVPAR